MSETEFRRLVETMNDEREGKGLPRLYERPEPRFASVALSLPVVVDGITVDPKLVERINDEIDRDIHEKVAENKIELARREHRNKMVDELLYRMEPGRRSESLAADKEQEPLVRYEYDKARRVHRYHGIGGVLAERKAEDGPLSEAELRGLAAKEHYFRGFINDDQAKRIREKTGAKEARKKQAEEHIQKILKDSKAAGK